MSAINEALKKAREQSPATTTGNSSGYLRPSGNTKPPFPTSMKFPFMLAVALVGIGFLLLRNFGSHSAPAPAFETVAPSPLQFETPQPVAAREGDSPTPSSVVESDPPTDYPRLRLQGIFHRQGDPFVIINSQTLGVGDNVEGVTVTKITPESVSLRWKDQLKTLTLR